MMIYSQHYFRRKLRRMPAPSCLPIAIIFGILMMCIVVVMPPIITGVKVDMPALNTQPIEIFDDFKYITVNITDNGINVNDMQIRQEEIGATIMLIHKNIKPEDIKIFIKAERGTNYDTIMSVLQTLNNDGFSDITLVGKYTGGVQNIK